MTTRRARAARMVHCTSTPRRLYEHVARARGHEIDLAVAASATANGALPTSALPRGPGRAVG
jgi:hypothetical protein